MPGVILFRPLPRKSYKDPMLKGSKENGLHSRFWESDRSRSTFSIPCLPDGTFDSARSWPVGFILLRCFLHQLMNHQWWLTASIIQGVCGRHWVFVGSSTSSFPPRVCSDHARRSRTNKVFFFAAQLFSYRYIIQDCEGYRIRRWPSFCRLLWLVKWQVHQNWITQLQNRNSNSIKVE